MRIGVMRRKQKRKDEKGIEEDWEVEPECCLDQV